MHCKHVAVQCDSANGRFFVLYLFAQNHEDNFHVNDEIKAVSGMCQKHTGHHNENTDACPELIKRL